MDKRARPQPFPAVSDVAREAFDLRAIGDGDFSARSAGCAAERGLDVRGALGQGEEGSLYLVVPIKPGLAAPNAIAVIDIGVGRFVAKAALDLICPSKRSTILIDMWIILLDFGAL